MKPQREVINEFIDLVWENDKPRIYIAGKPFMYCAFLVAMVDPADKANEEVTIEQLAERPGARVLEGGEGRDLLLTEQEIMWGFSSSLRGWVDLDYNTQALHANLSFPLLKSLAKAGDKKARRVLQGEIVTRLKENYSATTMIILDTCMDVIDEDTTSWIIEHLIEPELDKRESKSLGIIAATVHLKERLAIALARSNDVSVRRMVASQGKLSTIGGMAAIVDALKNDTDLNVIEILSTYAVKQAVATLAMNLVKIIAKHEGQRALLALDILIDANLNADTLDAIADAVCFKSSTSLMRSIVFVAARRRVMTSLLGKAALSSSSVGLLVDSLNVMEAYSTRTATKILNEDSIILRNALTRDTRAARFVIALKNQRTYEYFPKTLEYVEDSLHHDYWRVHGQAIYAGSGGGGGFIKDIYSNEDLENYLMYTGLKRDPVNASKLVGSYMVTWFSGSGKALETFAKELGLKLGRMPVRIGLLENYYIYESVYYETGRLYMLNESSTAVARYWKWRERAWQPLVLSPEMARLLAEK